MGGTEVIQIYRLDYDETKMSVEDISLEKSICMEKSNVLGEVEVSYNKINN
jgi:hypothetical protein